MVDEMVVQEAGVKIGQTSRAAGALVSISTPPPNVGIQWLSQLPAPSRKEANNTNLKKN